MNVLKNLTISVAFYGKFATIWWKRKKIHVQKREGTSWTQLANVGLKKRQKWSIWEEDFAFIFLRIWRKIMNGFAWLKFIYHFSQYLLIFFLGSLKLLSDVSSSNKCTISWRKNWTSFWYYLKLHKNSNCFNFQGVSELVVKLTEAVEPACWLSSTLRTALSKFSVFSLWRRWQQKFSLFASMIFDVFVQVIHQFTSKWLSSNWCF